MHLYIIIPYHSEPKDIYSPLLSCINSQINIDFNDLSIVICRSDGKDEFPDLTDWNNLEPITKFLSEETPLPGPGWSRQIGLNFVKNLEFSPDDYVLFFDIDDALTSTDSISRIIFHINESKSDALVFSYFRQKVDSGVKQYYQAPPWEIWSTAYNLQFMKANDIRCGLTFRIREDAFLTACLYSVPNVYTKFIDDPYYIYADGRATSTLNSDFASYSSENDLKEALKFWQEFQDWQCEGKTYFTVFDLLLQTICGCLKCLTINTRHNYKDSITAIKQIFEQQSTQEPKINIYCLTWYNYLNSINLG